MDKAKYLNRIKYSGSLEPNLTVLKKLQKAHLLNVPFENLDVHDNIPIELSIAKIFKKIVIENRGGFCYELNGLFYELLMALGFNAKRISARVYGETKGYGREFDHFAIIVTIDNTDYLSDVGFGEFIFEPLKLELGMAQNDERGNYVIDNFEGNYLRVNRIENGETTPEYIFKNIKREFEEYEEMCVFHQTSPDSHFTRKRLISLPTEKGRITLTDNSLKIREFETTTETEIKNEKEFNKHLQNFFYGQ